MQFRGHTGYELPERQIGDLALLRERFGVEACPAGERGLDAALRMREVKTPPHRPRGKASAVERLCRGGAQSTRTGGQGLRGSEVVVMGKKGQRCSHRFHCQGILEMLSGERDAGRQGSNVQADTSDANVPGARSLWSA